MKNENELNRTFFLFFLEVFYQALKFFLKRKTFSLFLSKKAFHSISLYFSLNGKKKEQLKKKQIKKTKKSNKKKFSIYEEVKKK